MIKNKKAYLNGECYNGWTVISHTSGHLRSSKYILKCNNCNVKICRSAREIDHLTSHKCDK